MNFLGNCITVRTTLDDGELLCQLAEEAVELADIADDYENGYFISYCLGEEGRLEDYLLEEIADVELVSYVLLKKEEREKLETELEEHQLSEYELRKLTAVCGVLNQSCLPLAKAALKLRRAMYKTNPTTITEEKAREELFENLKGVLILVHGIKSRIKNGSVKVENIKENKAARWVSRLTGGMGNEGVYEDRPEFLGK